MDLTPNAVIAGRYQVEKKVGAGGMGEVWLGQQVGIGVRVAIKTLLPATAANNEVIARFKREAYLLAQIRSDHVARVIDFVTDENYGLVLVMEFVEGDPLSRILQEKTLTVEEAIDLGVGIASALKDLHKANIIHRDLKPGNIIMAPTPDGRRRAVVVDFGVSRMMTDKSKDDDEELTGITRADMAVGTIEYMAPEQILNSRNVAPGSDIYAAGAMLFRAAAGRHIFNEAKSDGQLAQQKLTTDASPLPLPRDDKAAEGLIRVVGKMIKRRPSERYKTADEVLADLVPVRDMARGAVAELESTTIDGKGLTVPMPPGGLPGGMPLSRPSSGQVALVAQPAPTPAPTAAVAAAASVAQPTPISSPVSAPAPTSADSSVSVSAPQLPKPEAPPRRGIPPIVTFGLVAAALAAGIFLGPRLMAPAAPAAPVAIPEPKTASPAPTVTEAPTATAAPTETAAPSVSATAEAMPSATAAASTTAAATAPAMPSANAAALPKPGAAPIATSVPAPTSLPIPGATSAPAVSGAVKVMVVPGPMPKPPAPKGTAAPGATAPAPAKPAPVEPSGI